MATLNKFFSSLLVFGLALNCILYIFAAYNFNPLVSYGSTEQLSSMTGWFNLTPFNLLFTGATAAVVGVASLLLRQGTYAIYAMLLAALGMIISPIQSFILAIPNAVNSWLPANTNPNPTLFAIHPIVVVVSLLFAFAAYWFIFGLVIQREMS